MSFFLKKMRGYFYVLFIMPFVKRSFKKCGKNVSIAEGFKVNAKRVSIGNNSSIGRDANLLCTHADIKIGNNVMIAQGLTMITGRHRYNVVGRYMSEITEKEKEPMDDLPIVIKDDV